MKAIIGKLKAIYYILRYRNFILTYAIEHKINNDGEPYTKVAYLRRTDHNTEQDFYAMKWSMLYQFGYYQMDENGEIGEYIKK